MDARTFCRKPRDLGNLAVSQLSCFRRVAWPLGTERMIQLDSVQLRQLILSRPVATKKAKLTIGFSLPGAHQGGRSLRDSVKFMFYISPNWTDCHKYSELHTIFVLKRDSTEQNHHKREIQLDSVESPVKTKLLKIRAPRRERITEWGNARKIGPPMTFNSVFHGVVLKSVAKLRWNNILTINVFVKEYEEIPRWCLWRRKCVESGWHAITDVVPTGVQLVMGCRRVFSNLVSSMLRLYKYRDISNIVPTET
ncbi:hypothetical protein T265_08294 [Opisthorchis viverrini]|uniref:Uncharacterized protein n=1 Tax=Opisthorchis viverrini TaxID=6198 RepID=A0A074Z9Y7_OPIVI|nr:hypothetical protein T265_08294 [Opisthorchis viverrini]KER23933.1 hypothetical protein T265_08294 [Opisthorchis viverrini]